MAPSPQRDIMCTDHSPQLNRAIGRRAPMTVLELYRDEHTAWAHFGHTAAVVAFSDRLVVVGSSTGHLLEHVPEILPADQCCPVATLTHCLADASPTWTIYAFH